jgi:hypothetical protein
LSNSVERKRCAGTVQFRCDLLIKSAERLVREPPPSLLSIKRVERSLQLDHQSSLLLRAKLRPKINQSESGLGKISTDDFRISRRCNS